MFSSADARRRWFGAFFVICAGGMLIWGQTVLHSRLRGVGFLIYWLVCFLLVLLAMLTALLDLRAMRKRARDQQRDLVQEALDEVKSADRRKQK